MLAMKFPVTILGEAYLLAIFATFCLIMPPPIGAYVAVLMALVTLIMFPELPSQFMQSVRLIYGALNNPAVLGAATTAGAGGYLLM
jgi:hypothetical protein